MARRKDFSVDLASDEATREQMLAAFRRASELGLISQVRLEAELGVDQGQVSKILRGNFVYPRGNARRIFTYVKNQLDGRGDLGVDTNLLREELTRKLMAVWDETSEGARALSVLLDGAAGLQARRR